MSKSPRSRPPSTVLVVRDEAKELLAQQRQRADELLGHIRRNIQAATDSFYEVGQALAEIANNKLYVAKGYSNFADMLAGERLMSQQQASKAIAVATLMPRESVVALGQEKSYAVVHYSRVAQRPVQRLLKGPAIDGHAVSELSVREIFEAARQLSDRSDAPVNSEEVRRRKLARESQVKLRRAGLANATVATSRRAGKRIFRIELDEEMLERILAWSR